MQPENQYDLLKVDRDKLAKEIEDAYDDIEFNTLCLALKVQRTLQKSLKQAQDPLQKAYILIDYFKRRDNYDVLVRKILEDRPKLKDKLLTGQHQNNEGTTASHEITPSLWKENVISSSGETVVREPKIESLSAKETLEAQTEGASFLQIAFTPPAPDVTGNKHEQASFEVKAWLWDAFNEPKTYFYRKYIVFQLTTVLPGVLFDIVNEAAGRLKNRSGQLVIELFLPYVLLCSDLDQWMIDLGENELNSITKEYPVVVRSLERVTDQNEARRKKWSDYWDKFEKRTSRIQLKVFSQEAYQKAKGNFINVLRGALNQEKFPLLTFVPPSITIGKSHPLLTMLNAGTPIAFWLRQPPDELNEAEIVLACENLLLKRNFFTLPQSLWQERTMAIEQNNTQHVTHYLTLLWDNPRLVPRDLSTLSIPFSPVNGEKSNERLADL